MECRNGEGDAETDGGHQCDRSSPSDSAAQRPGSERQVIAAEPCATGSCQQHGCSTQIERHVERGVRRYELNGAAVRDEGDAHGAHKQRAIKGGRPSLGDCSVVSHVPILAPDPMNGIDGSASRVMLVAREAGM